MGGPSGSTIELTAQRGAIGCGECRPRHPSLRRLEPRPPGMTVAVEEWLKRIPRFTLAGDVATSSGAIAFGRLLAICCCSSLITAAGITVVDCGAAILLLHARWSICPPACIKSASSH